MDISIVVERRSGSPDSIIISFLSSETRRARLLQLAGAVSTEQLRGRARLGRMAVWRSRLLLLSTARCPRALCAGSHVSVLPSLVPKRARPSWGLLLEG